MIDQVIQISHSKLRVRVIDVSFVKVTIHGRLLDWLHKIPVSVSHQYNQSDRLLTLPSSLQATGTIDQNHQYRE